MDLVGLNDDLASLGGAFHKVDSGMEVIGHVVVNDIEGHVAPATAILSPFRLKYCRACA